MVIKDEEKKKKQNIQSSSREIRDKKKNEIDKGIKRRKIGDIN